MLTGEADTADGVNGDPAVVLSRRNESQCSSAVGSAKMAPIIDPHVTSGPVTPEADIIVPSIRLATVGKHPLPRQRVLTPSRRGFLRD